MTMPAVRYHPYDPTARTNPGLSDRAMIRYLRRQTMQPTREYQSYYSLVWKRYLDGRLKTDHAYYSEIPGGVAHTFEWLLRCGHDAFSLSWPDVARPEIERWLSQNVFLVGLLVAGLQKGAGQ